MDSEKITFPKLGKIMMYLAIGAVALVLVLGILSYIFDDGGGISNVNVTNISANSATITWTTDDKVNGKVLVQEGEGSWVPILSNFQNDINYDDRDTEQNDDGDYVVSSETGLIPRYTHHVTLRDLDPETEYNFRILGVNKLFDGGIDAKFKTYSVQSNLKVPDPAYGSVWYIDSSKIDPIDGVVLYRLVELDQNDEITNSSNWYSTTLNLKSNWAADIGSLRNADGEYYTYDNNTFLEIMVETEHGSGKYLGSIEDGYKPVENIFVESEENEGENLSFKNNNDIFATLVSDQVEFETDIIQEVGANGCLDVTPVPGTKNQSGYFFSADASKCYAYTDFEQTCSISTSTSACENYGAIDPRTGVRIPSGCDFGGIPKSGATSYQDGQFFSYDNKCYVVGPGLTKAPGETALKCYLETDMSRCTGETNNSGGGSSNTGGDRDQCLNVTPVPGIQPVNGFFYSSNGIECYWYMEEGCPVIRPRHFCANQDAIDPRTGTVKPRGCEFGGVPKQGAQVYYRKISFKYNNTCYVNVKTTPIPNTDPARDCYVETKPDRWCPDNLNTTNNSYETSNSGSANTDNGSEEGNSRSNRSMRDESDGFEEVACVGSSDVQIQKCFNKENGYKVEVEGSNLFYLCNGENVIGKEAGCGFQVQGNNEDDDDDEVYVPDEPNEPYGFLKSSIGPVIYGPNNNMIHAKLFFIGVGVRHQGVDFEFRCQQTGWNTPVYTYPPSEFSYTDIPEENRTRLSIITRLSDDSYRQGECKMYFEGKWIGYNNSTPNKLDNTIIKSTNAQQTDQLDSGTYLIQYDSGKTFEITVNSDNAEIVYFDDLNADNIKQEDEPISDNPPINVRISKTADIVTYDLNIGWNLIGLSVISDDWEYASDLFDEMIGESFGEDITHLYTFRNGDWLEYGRRVDDVGNKIEFGEDYKINAGGAYFVKSNIRQAITLEGKTFEEPLSFDVINGWNLISLQGINRDYFAEELLMKCLNDGIFCDTLSRFDSGNYIPVVYENEQLFGNDFQMFSKQGYFLRVQDGGPFRFTP